MPMPGAKPSTQRPQFEKGAHQSLTVDAATVKALGAAAGEYEHASSVSFPAATATKTPEATRFSTAVLSAGETKAPPNDMFATAGSTRFTRTQSIALIRPDSGPPSSPQSSLSTFTARSSAPLAT